MTRRIDVWDPWVAESLGWVGNLCQDMLFDKASVEQPEADGRHERIQGCKYIHLIVASKTWQINQRYSCRAGKMSLCMCDKACDKANTDNRAGTERD
eukprot:jgi/Chrzof1/10426/UNPLg00352.t1